MDLQLYEDLLVTFQPNISADSGIKDALQSGYSGEDSKYFDLPLEIRDNMLYNNDIMLVSKKDVNAVLFHLHDNSEHDNADIMRENASETYSWPTMDEDIVNYYNLCAQCNPNKQSKNQDNDIQEAIQLSIKDQRSKVTLKSPPTTSTTATTTTTTTISSSPPTTPPPSFTPLTLRKKAGIETVVVIDSDSDSQPSPPLAKPRGRPRKTVAAKEEVDSDPEQPSPPVAKPRGRPRKVVPALNQEDDEDEDEEEEDNDDKDQSDDDYSEEEEEQKRKKKRINNKINL
ncbi:hypothetical protein DFA_11446 [Cavenderia fasciculata]|uniref:Integrase zinc-binding domain-containing protein n=1 Tax=Cavenderia fasciculata TaxID=261658 RepID=F4QD04_CACFS|nr:uncharacterized protein DFA_11446 [Cavenderia fasciculata]EGG13685.1 hypothetical protein DFA_11446 [Cavenderia fasciculata]|eukprot:XP_004350389.1 hypothetical protein DFA_11446 [Cavenderia fasciculata]